MRLGCRNTSRTVLRMEITLTNGGLDFAVTKEKKSFIKLLLSDPRYQSGKRYHPSPTLINNNSLWTLLLNLGQRQLQNTIIEFRNSFLKSNPRTRILSRNLHLALKFPSL